MNFRKQPAPRESTSEVVGDDPYHRARGHSLTLRGVFGCRLKAADVHAAKPMTRAMLCLAPSSRKVILHWACHGAV